MKASDVVQYGGHPIDRLTMERLKSANLMLRSTHFGAEKSDMTCLQGIGGYVKSGGTHVSGGCEDTTAFNWKNRQYVGRLLGGADYHRPYNWDNARGGEHIHWNTIGAGYASGSAKRQWTAYYAGRNALANNAKDTGPRLATKPLFVAPWTDRGARGTYYLKKGFTARTEGSTKTKSKGAIPKGAKFSVVAVVNSSGILWGINKDGKHVAMSVLTKTKPTGSTTPLPTQKKTLRIGTLNFPDKTKITVASEADRIKRAVQQINAADLDIIGLQEGVGSDADGPDADKAREPSDLMVRLDKALGSDWDLVEPTLAYNENYFLRRTGTTDYRQHDDAVIRGSSGGKALSGRHVTLVDFVTAIGTITIGNTQLINNNRPGAVVQAGLAAAALKKAAGSHPHVLLGDFNTTPPTLTTLAGAGLRDSRVVAHEAGNRNAVTYTNQIKTKPSTNPDWLLDGIWVSKTITVNGYTVVLDLDKDGNFILPRVGDHSLTIVSLS